MSSRSTANGDAAKWRTVLIVAVSIGAILTLITPPVAVVWTLSSVRQDQAVGLATLRGEQATAMERLRGDMLSAVSERLTDLERRQDEKFVNKEYLRAELDRALAEAVLSGKKDSGDGKSDQ